MQESIDEICINKQNDFVLFKAFTIQKSFFCFEFKNLLYIVNKNYICYYIALLILVFKINQIFIFRNRCYYKSLQTLQYFILFFQFMNIPKNEMHGLRSWLSRNNDSYNKN